MLPEFKLVLLSSEIFVAKTSRNIDKGMYIKPARCLLLTLPSCSVLSLVLSGNGNCDGPFEFAG